MLDPDSTDLDAALDGIPDDPEPVPPGEPAVAVASAPAPSPTASAPLTSASAATSVPPTSSVPDAMRVWYGGVFLEGDLDEMYADMVDQEASAYEIAQVNSVQMRRYNELLPEAHAVTTDLLNSARRVVERYMTGPNPRLADPEDAFLVELLSMFHPTADEATIKSALRAAYQEVSAL